MAHEQPLPSRARSILVIGAGELGNAILSALTSHPRYSRSQSKITLLIRPSSLSAPSAEKAAQHAALRARGIELVGGDIEAASQEELAKLFRPFSAVLHAGGMGSVPGTMMKVTRAVLDASGNGGVEYYVPWQHGVDYDVITRQGGQGMFSEQIDVRDVLRAQHSTDWVVLSCGVFMSFLFEEFWGVVERKTAAAAATAAATDGAGQGEEEEGKKGEQIIQVTALNSWDDLITTTTATDIGRCTAELLLCADTPVNTPVYIAGDTLTYSAFADTIARATSKTVIRRVWPLEYLREESRKDPDDQLKRYRVVFSEGKGLSWDKEGTWSAKRGLKLQGVEDWVKENFV